MTSSKSRHIPNEISLAVQKRHYFQCAWCCTKLTERHHIKEYALGGQHTEDNLILLCPNCHTQVHKDRISKSELLKRKSTHLKNDRVESIFTLESQVPTFKLGGVLLINTKILLSYKGEPIFTWKKGEDGDIMLIIRLYDSDKNLVFWMANDRYWAPSSVSITRAANVLTISYEGPPYQFVKFEKLDDIIEITGFSYLDDFAFVMHKDNLFCLSQSYIDKFVMNLSEVGIQNFHTGICINSLGS